jgi:cell division protein FtsL
MGALLLNLVSKILVVLFLVGLVGSAIVVLITFFEDAKLLLERDQPKVKPEAEVAEVVSARTGEAF